MTVQLTDEELLEALVLELGRIANEVEAGGSLEEAIGARRDAELLRTAAACLLEVLLLLYAELDELEQEVIPH